MTQEYSSKTIEHLGLVSAMYDELGISEIVNQAIKQDLKQRTVNLGQLLKAMVLNGLGFAQRRLYLTPHFFSDKPIEQLIGSGIQADHLNDDALGKALDAFFAYGVTELFNLIAMSSVQRLKLTSKVVHDDITSFHVDGNYNANTKQSAVEEQGLIQITKGYSRDSKPNLNQVALELICEHQAGIPVAMQALSGNQNDKTAFENSVSLHVSQLRSIGVKRVIKDSAGYTQKSLIELQKAGQDWIMRVPNTIKAVQNWTRKAQRSEFQDLTEGYSYQTRTEDYGGIPQRWLLVYSQAGYERELVSQTKSLTKLSQIEYQTLTKLSRLEFSCESDARAALSRVERKLVFINVLEVKIIPVVHYKKAGKPTMNSLSSKAVKLEFLLSSPSHALQQAAWTGCLFVLATSELDEQELSDEDVLVEYKGQARVEGGFRFLKDPMFLASTIFLKKVERVTALLMVMTVCLLVYAALEFRIRGVLRENASVIPDQKGKGTSVPTARWVFELMSGVYLLFVGGVERALTLNLRVEVRGLLALLGAEYLGAYP